MDVCCWPAHGALASPGLGSVKATPAMSGRAKSCPRVAAATVLGRSANRRKSRGDEFQPDDPHEEGDGESDDETRDSLHGPLLRLRWPNDPELSHASSQRAGMKSQPIGGVPRPFHLPVAPVKDVYNVRPLQGSEVLS